MNKIYFLDTGFRSPKFNMACDYYFARNLKDAPVFRTYGWTPFTVSLGYHQKEEEVDREAIEKAGFAVVRRETGGRAVFHAEELTYSMIVAKDSFLYSDSIMKVYNRISSALVKGLHLSGVESAELEKGALPDFKKLYKEKLSSVCFSSTSTYEVISEGKKLVGSAQKRLKNSILQHGSMLIGEKHMELIDYLTISDRLKERFKEQVKQKTVSVSEIIPVNNFIDFYNTLSLNLRKALELEYEAEVQELTLTDDEIEKIKECEQYF